MRLTIPLLAITTFVVMMTPAAPAAVERVNRFDEIAPARASTQILPRSLVTSSQRPPERSMVGTLEQVDDQASEFVVKTANGHQRFVLLDGATIRQGSKTIKAADLASHKGERVKVRYRESSGQRRAEWIVVASPPSHKAKTSTD